MVSHLFLPGSQVWNKDLVELIFRPPTAKSILQMPLALSPRFDELFWPYNTDGPYTTKSGYDFLRQKKLCSAASTSSTQTAPIKFWKDLWHVQALPQCKETVWRDVRGILPVRKLLQVRGVDVEDGCPFCHSATETIDHVLLLCPVTLRWWFTATGGLRIQDNTTVQGFFQHILELHDSTLEALSVAVLWVIWEACNQCIFQGKEPTVEGILARVQMMKAPPRVLPVVAGAREVRDLSASWLRPTHNTIKLNFDGTWKLHSPTGYGCVARNEHGLVMAAATTYPNSDFVTFDSKSSCLSLKPLSCKGFVLFRYCAGNGLPAAVSCLE